MSEPANRIPPAILKMLADNQWRPTEGYSAFDSVWNTDPDFPELAEHTKERQRDPSFYHFRRDNLAEDNNGVSGKEVEALSALDMFEGLIGAYPDGFSFNEHAQHALADFCCEVYDAYRKLKERLQMGRSLPPAQGNQAIALLRLFKV